MPTLQRITQLLSSLDWKGAVLGAIVSGVFAGSFQTARALWNRRPIRRFLGDLADDKKVVSVFVRDVVSADNKYQSERPTGEVDYWQNYRVVGRADVEVATDAVNLLGQVGRTKNIVWRQVNRDAELWSEPIICAGGSFKAEKALELCVPRLARYESPQTFVTLPDERRFDMKDGYDYGLIYRSFHPQTNVPCVLLFGFGVSGTEAAGAFLRTKAKRLARLYGPRAFAAIVRIRDGDGRDSGELVWLSPGVSPFARFLHFPTWKRDRKLLGKIGLPTHKSENEAVHSR
jgi:hypothetical protein